MKRGRLFVLLLGAVLPALPAAAETRAPAAIEATVTPIFQKLAALKAGPAPGAPPPLIVRSREETRRFIEGELDRRYPTARLEAERKSMAAWGLIPSDYDLRRLFLDLMEEQVSAYYDPRAKAMVLGDWLTPAEQEVALLHELVHALQDREIPLDRFIAPIPGKGDEVLARQALIEGEATGVMLDVLLRSTGADLASLPDVGAIRGQIAAGSIGPAIQRAPVFLRDLLLFPYVEGLSFIHQWRKRHPWTAMSELYRSPPRSTTQILHPEKLLDSREDPIPIMLPALDSLLLDFHLVTEDEMGEFGLGAVLALAAGEAEGRRGALGWRGDRFRLWEDRQGRSAIAYLVALDSEGAAKALAPLLARAVESRHPALARVRTPAAMGTLVRWRDDDRTSVVEQRGCQVLLLEQVPAGAADRLRDAIWRSHPASSRP